MLALLCENHCDSMLCPCPFLRIVVTIPHSRGGAEVTDSVIEVKFLECGIASSFKSNDCVHDRLASVSKGFVLRLQKRSFGFGEFTRCEKGTGAVEGTGIGTGEELLCEVGQLFRQAAVR